MAAIRSGRRGNAARRLLPPTRSAIGALPLQHPAWIFRRQAADRVQRRQILSGQADRGRGQIVGQLDTSKNRWICV